MPHNPRSHSVTPYCSSNNPLGAVDGRSIPLHDRIARGTLTQIRRSQVNESSQRNAQTVDMKVHMQTIEVREVGLQINPKCAASIGTSTENIDENENQLEYLPSTKAWADDSGRIVVPGRPRSAILANGIRHVSLGGHGKGVTGHATGYGNLIALRLPALEDIVAKGAINTPLRHSSVEALKQSKTYIRSPGRARIFQQLNLEEHLKSVEKTAWLPSISLPLQERLYPLFRSVLFHNFYMKEVESKAFNAHRLDDGYIRLIMDRKNVGKFTEWFDDYLRNDPSIKHPDWSRDSSGCFLPEVIIRGVNVEGLGSDGNLFLRKVSTSFNLTLLSLAAQLDTPQYAESIYSAVKEKLTKIHETGLYHGDFKEDNVLLDDVPKGVNAVRVIDFEKSFFFERLPDKIFAWNRYYAQAFILLGVNENEQITIGGKSKSTEDLLSSAYSRQVVLFMDNKVLSNPGVINILKMIEHIAFILSMATTYQLPAEWAITRVKRLSGIEGPVASFVQNWENAITAFYHQLRNVHPLSLASGAPPQNLTSSDDHAASGIPSGDSLSIALRSSLIDEHYVNSHILYLNCHTHPQMAQCEHFIDLILLRLAGHNEKCIPIVPIQSSELDYQIKKDRFVHAQRLLLILFLFEVIDVWFFNITDKLEHDLLEETDLINSPEFLLIKSSTNNFNNAVKKRLDACHSSGGVRMVVLNRLKKRIINPSVLNNPVGQAQRFTQNLSKPLLRIEDFSENAVAVLDGNNTVDNQYSVTRLYQLFGRKNPKIIEIEQELKKYEYKLARLILKKLNDVT